MVLCRDNGTQKVIYDETSPTYVERPERGTVRFIDGDRFLVMNETTTGWNHIYLHSVAKGLVRPLTSGEWQVTGIAEVTDDAVYYLSTERSPLRRDLYAVDFKGKRKRRLTDRDGTYSIAPSKGMKYYISTFSSATEGNTVELRGGDGRFIRTLAESEKMTERMKSLPRREFFTFVSERGDSLNAYIIKPTDFDPAEKYPVLLTQYSGPGSQSVADRLSFDWENVLVGNGYIVVCCDAAARDSWASGSRSRRTAIWAPWRSRTRSRSRVTWLRNPMSIPTVSAFTAGRTAVSWLWDAR